MLNDVLKNVAVLGAAGKMGSGISLLLLEEMARREAENNGKSEKGNSGSPSLTPMTRPWPG